jgi:hypothetical protein
MKSFLVLAAMFGTAAGFVEAQASPPPQDVITNYHTDEQGFPIGFSGVSDGLKTKVDFSYLDDNCNRLKLPYIYRVSKLQLTSDGSYQYVSGPWLHVADDTVDATVCSTLQP